MPNHNCMHRTGTRFVKLKALIFVFLVLIAGSDDSVGQIESTAFSVLQMDASARSAALGGSSSALLDPNSSVLFANPALLRASADGRLEFSYLNHLSDINAGWLSYGRQVDSLATFAVGLRYLSFGSFDERDVLGDKVGTFGASDVSLTFGASRPWRSALHYGASLEVVRSSVASNAASAVALSAGITMHDEQSGMTYSASVHHAGLVLSSIGRRKDDLPTDLRFGATKKLAHLPLLVSVTAYRLHQLDGGPEGSGSVSNVLHHLKLAGEFQFSKAFQVRFGYDHRKHDALKVKSRLDMAGFSTGFGIALSRIGFDYSFNSWSSLGALHRFTIVSSI